MKKIKKVVSLIMALAILFSVNVFASNVETNNEIIRHLVVFPNVENPVAEDARAITRPTSTAPDSWYGVTHRWSCTNYVYSSYLFEKDKADKLDFDSDQDFSVELYLPDGTLLCEERAIQMHDADQNPTEHYYVYFDIYRPFEDNGTYTEYYFIIRNESNSPINVSDDTTYVLYG